MITDAEEKGFIVPGKVGNIDPSPYHSFGVFPLFCCTHAILQQFGVTNDDLGSLE